MAAATLLNPVPPTARAASDYQFADVTAVAGVADAEHPHFGATWSDYNNDENMDLYVVNGAGDPLGVEDENVLYRNNGDGTFTDVTVETGTGDPYVAMRNVWADYDRDGDLDLYSHNFVQSTLYRNDGNLFSDVNGVSGAGITMAKGTGAAWGDYDNDGWLDLHATGFPGVNALLHNNGDGTFTDMQASSGMSLAASGMGNAWGDYDLDGDLDMAITAVTKDDPTFLYKNNGDGTFTDVTVEVGILVEAGSSNAAVNWVDYDNDGDWDLHITEVSTGSEKTLPNRMYLFENQGDATFLDSTSSAGLMSSSMGNFWDAAFADYDNDGDVDLYVAGSGADLFYQNNGDGTFTDIAPSLGMTSKETNWGIIWADYDNDGDLDMYVVRNGNPAPNTLFQNQGGTNNWLQLELRGTVSNLDAIGARVTVVANGQTQMREVNGGSGFYSQNSPIQQFGLGSSTTVESVEIVWPSGVVQNVTGLAINERHVIVESAVGLPTASFTTSPGASPLDMDFDASASSDDGAIVSYDWDFGDGTQGTGVMTTHTYAAAGSYDVTLVVTDDETLTGTTTQATIVTDGSNLAPTAKFSASSDGLSVAFMDESTDSDGVVVAWAWDFGDGATSESQHPSHDYSVSGQYTVLLSVTDDQGDSDSTSLPVVVSEPSGASVLHVGDLDGSQVDDGRGWQATVAVTVHDENHVPVTGATVSGDWKNGVSRLGSCVTDTDGVCTITQDRIRDTTTSVTFATTDISLDVLTYDAGANHDPDADSDGTEITISSTGNSGPTADFTWMCAGSICDFSDASSDTDGSIVSWSWDFGDTESSPAEDPSHTYTADGTYTVALTVTDNEGSIGSTSKSVTTGTPGGATTVQVADLDAVAISQGGTDWLAIVTVAVVDDDGVPVAGATVSTAWRGGTTVMCTSNAAGVCDVEQLIAASRTSMKVSDVTHPTLTYDPGSNADPDGDSDGTTIIILGP